MSKFSFLPVPTKGHIKNYQLLMHKAPKGSIIRPAFIFDEEVYIKINKDPNHIGQTTSMKIDNSLVPILTGVKSKHTREYMIGLKIHIRDGYKKDKSIQVTTIQRDYFKHVTETLGEWDRLQALKLQANYLRRMTVASLISQQKVCTRQNWDEDYKYIYSITVPQYLALMDEALNLPSEFCDDERLGV